MIKRTAYFTDPCSVCLKNSQLVIANELTGQVRTIPIEDLGVVVVENQQVKITIPALIALSDNNCAVVFCNAKHMPCSMLQNLDSNSTQSELFRKQIDATEPLKKQLWKQTVEAKIRNQANLLSEVTGKGEILKPYFMNVKSGDTDNREGIAAKIYWRALWGDGFLREPGGPSPNSLLDYGYTILRAAVARALMSSGLQLAFGLFHKNRYNAFPLADDIMEPYRPYVDNLVYNLCKDGQSELNKETKCELLKITYKDVIIQSNRHPLDIGLSITTASLARCYEGKAKNILFPAL